jgi:hypothetical protein
MGLLGVVISAWFPLTRNVVLKKVKGCEYVIAIGLDGRRKKKVAKAVRWEVVTEMTVTVALFWHVTPWGHSYTVTPKAAGVSKRAVHL